MRIECSDMDGQKRSLLALAMAVNRSCHQFLAHPAFSGDEHARFTRSDQSNSLEDNLHSRTSSDDFLIAKRLQWNSLGLGIRRFSPDQRSFNSIQRLA